MDQNSEKNLQVSIFGYLIEKEMYDIADDFRKRANLTTADLEKGTDSLLSVWKKYNTWTDPTTISGSSADLSSSNPIWGVGLERWSPSISSNLEIKGSSLSEFTSFSSETGRLVCCDFSINQDYLACYESTAVVVWNQSTNNVLKTIKKPYHELIKDVRFSKDSSNRFAVNTGNKIQLWDINDLNKPHYIYRQYEEITSMAFYPENSEQLYFSDKSGITIWNLYEDRGPFSKEDTRQIRFHQGGGNNMLAALTCKEEKKHCVLYDVETKFPVVSLDMGHDKDVHTICWDASGKYIVSVSENQARIWSLQSSAKPIYEFKARERLIHSCTFHPHFPMAFAMGSDQTLEVWNPTVSNDVEVVSDAHPGIVNAVCSSAGLLASTSEDKCKLWH